MPDNAAFGGYDSAAEFERASEEGAREDALSNLEAGDFDGSLEAWEALCGDGGMADEDLQWGED